jgi:hypothetical protein
MLVFGVVLMTVMKTSLSFFELLTTIFSSRQIVACVLNNVFFMASSLNFMLLYVWGRRNEYAMYVEN